MEREIRLEIEELEERIAPAITFVIPSGTECVRVPNEAAVGVEQIPEGELPGAQSCRGI